MRRFADAGPTLERGLERLETLAGRRSITAMFAGILLGLAVIAGGLAGFLLVLFILVEVLR
jgi:hypothetical protein